MQELENQIKDVVGKCNYSRATLKAIEDVVPNIDQEIIQTEAIKYHVCRVPNYFLNVSRDKIITCRKNLW